MEFIVEETDINDEQMTDDLDVDLGSSSHSLDWKLNPNVECRVTLERMQSFHNENKVQRDPDENGVAETETSSEQNESVNKSCGIYRKLKLLVDDLKYCEKREECELCEKLIQQLQQHLLLNHSNNREDAQGRNSIETETESNSLESSGISFEEKNFDIEKPDSDNTEKTEDEIVPIGPDSQEELASDTNMVKRKSISKGGKSKPFKCETCGKGFLTFYELTQHKRVHNAETRNSNHLNPKILQTQKKGSNSNSKVRRGSLTKHKLVHAGLKSNKCDVCGKCFTKNFSLTRHKMTHTGENPWKCDVCGKRFNLNSNLNQHKLTHTGEKPYRCEVCGKCFLCNSHLNQHKLTHTGERPCKCDVCGKCFICNSHLNQHKLIHTGEKRYRCELCGKRFNQCSTLTVHILTHTKEKPYKCELCGKCFNCLSSLHRHKLIHTR